MAVIGRSRRSVGESNVGEPTFLEDLRDAKENWHDPEYRKGFIRGFVPAFLRSFALSFILGFAIVFLLSRSLG